MGQAPQTAGNGTGTKWGGVLLWLWRFLLLITCAIMSMSQNLFEPCPICLQDDGNGEHEVTGESK